LPEGWKNTLPVGLYRLWLQTQPEVYWGAKEMKMQLPVTEGEEIVYKLAIFKRAPGPIVPFTSFIPSAEEGTLGRLTMTWPPPDSDEPAPVSIEMESRRFYGQLRWETRVIDGRTIEVVVPERDPELLGMNLWFRWPEPFKHFFPTGGGHDLWMHQATSTSAKTESTAATVASSVSIRCCLRSCSLPNPVSIRFNVSPPKGV
jgi:hypothetical protein